MIFGLSLSDKDLFILRIVKCEDVSVLGIIPNTVKIPRQKTLVVSKYIAVLLTSKRNFHSFVDSDALAKEI